MAKKFVLNLGLIVSVLSFGPNTFAETLSSKLDRAVGLSSVLKQKWSTKPAVAHGHVRMEGMRYLTSIPGQEDLTNSYLLSARLSGTQETSWFNFAGDIYAGTFFSAGQSHFSVAEAYISTKGKNFKLYLGRKKMEWSETDRRWDLGMVQSRWAMDLLRPQEQGLVGLFADYNTRYLQLSGMVTPIFIPNLGNEYREEGGSLVTDNRWYRPPSNNYDFNNKINRLVYRLDIPDYLDLVSEPGAMLMARVGSKDKGAWATVSGGYIPANELLLMRQNFKAAAAERVDVTVTPVVTHHTVYAADMGYTINDNIAFGVSYLTESPKEIRPEKDWAIQRFEAIEFYSAFIDLRIKDFNFVINDVAFQLEYLNAKGGNIVDIDSEGNPDDFTIFEDRLMFKDAISVAVQGQLTTLYKRPLMTKFKYLYDYEQRGSITSTEFLYFPGKKWAVVVGADILGVKDEEHETSKFINQYRANDRYYGGVTYVF